MIPSIPVERQVLVTGETEWACAFVPCLCQKGNAGVEGILLRSIEAVLLTDVVLYNAYMIFLF